MESGDGGASGLLIPYSLFFGCVMVFDFGGRQKAMEEIKRLGLVGVAGNKCGGGGI